MPKITLTEVDRRCVPCIDDKPMSLTLMRDFIGFFNDADNAEARLRLESKLQEIIEEGA